MSVETSMGSGRNVASHKRSWRKIRPTRRALLWITLIAVVLFCAGEMALRKVGFGNPLLTMGDAEMEYRLVPDQDVHRRGKRIRINHYSMRADDFGPTRSSADELRILMIGDSVVFGGSQCDQSEVASSILDERLSKKLGRAVTVGNVSAGSWGPENELGYANEFGFFDADVVIIVWSSHDGADRMVRGGDTSWVERKPLLAYVEAFQWLARRMDSSSDPDGRRVDDVCMAAAEELILKAKRTGAAVIVAQHLEETEEPGSPQHAAFTHVAEVAGAKLVQLGPSFRKAKEQGVNPWRDFIHPSAFGQRLIADELEPAILEMLPAKQTPSR